jgi:hypothetical protein
MRINIRPAIVGAALGLLALGATQVVRAQQQPSVTAGDTGAVPGPQTGRTSQDTSTAADASGGVESGQVMPADTSSYTPPRSDSGTYAPPDSGTYAPPRSDSGTYAPPSSDSGAYAPPRSPTTAFHGGG